jgi:sec-independent protein translocase protein TatB
VFNVTGTEIILLLLVALIVLGPEKLPDAVRRFGRTYGEFKRMSAGFQAELRDALEEPSRELRSTVQAAKDIVQTPVQEVRSTARGVKDLAHGKTPGAAKKATAGDAAAAAAVPGRPSDRPPPALAAEAEASADAEATAPNAAEAPPADDFGTVPDELWDGEPGR